MAVEAVLGDVELSVFEPFGEGKIPLKHGAEVAGPAQQFSGLARPESLVVGVGFVIQRTVVGQGLSNKLC